MLTFLPNIKIQTFSVETINNITTLFKLEKLRECLKSMTLNSDYVSGILASHIRESACSGPELHA